MRPVFTWIIAVSAAAVWLGQADSASAQGIQRRPAVSPYLNLLQFDGGLGEVPNYQTLVRPQLQQRRMNRQTNMQLRSLQSQVGGLQQTVGAIAAPTGLRPTGRSGTDLSSYYGNLDHYYGGSRLSSGIR